MADALHNQIAAGLATVAAGITGGSAYISTMRGAHAAPMSNLPPAPQTVIGPPSGRLTAAAHESLAIRFPMRVYLGKLRNLEQTQHDTNEWIDAFIVAFRGSAGMGIDLGLAALGVTAALIESWDSDKYYEINNEPIQLIDFVVAVFVDRPVVYQ
jgi:hypothetical protein